MTLDRRIELRIFDDIQAVPGGTPKVIAHLWADRLSASLDRIEITLSSTDATLLVDYRIRWRQDLEGIKTGLVIVRDEAGRDFSVSSISIDDSRRSFLTLHSAGLA